MPRLTDATRQQRREAIAAAAMRCFARNGFASTSMADIIAEAGSSAGSVYANFADKAELVRFTASAALRDLTAAVSAEAARERTPATVLGHLLTASSDRQRAQTLLQIWAELPRDEELERIGRHSVHELRGLIQDAVSPRRQNRSTAPQPEALADAMLTVLQGFLVRIAIDRDVDTGVLADRTVALFE